MVLLVMPQSLWGHLYLTVMDGLLVDPDGFLAGLVWHIFTDVTLDTLLS